GFSNDLHGWRKTIHCFIRLWNLDRLFARRRKANNSCHSKSTSGKTRQPSGISSSPGKGFDCAELHKLPRSRSVVWLTSSREWMGGHDRSDESQGFDSDAR